MSSKAKLGLHPHDATIEGKLMAIEELLEELQLMAIEELQEALPPEKRDAALKEALAVDIHLPGEFADSVNHGHDNYHGQEKALPLHVRVAEALGCKPEKPKYGDEWDCCCSTDVDGEYPHSEHKLHGCHDYEGLSCEPQRLVRYDRDWSATGPLIAEHEITVTLDEDVWFAYTPTFDPGACGPLPLIAVCNLLLALSAAGRLPHD